MWQEEGAHHLRGSKETDSGLPVLRRLRWSRYVDDEETAVKPKTMTREAWRTLQLLDEGFDLGSAQEIALTHCDYQKAIRMKKQGCPPTLVARILG